MKSRIQKIKKIAKELKTKLKELEMTAKDIRESVELLNPKVNPFLELDGVGSFKPMNSGEIGREICG